MFEPNRAQDSAPNGLPMSLEVLRHEGEDDRPVPALGVGDHHAAVALLAATRSLVTAASAEEVAIALARFTIQMGGDVVLARADEGRAIPLDIAMGTGTVILADADPMSVARMRLEQCLPSLVEDARTTVARLAHLQDVQASSDRDSLTGLLSRRALMRALARVGPGDVVCLIDIDSFKTLNDTGGHDSGDEVLRALGRLLDENVRGLDTAGRYGGDELVLIQYSVTEQAATRRMRDVQHRWLSARPRTVTFSAGVCGVDERGWETALRRADAAMYAAKLAGRDLVCSASEVLT